MSDNKIVELSKDTIDSIFERAEHQSEWVLDLFKTVYYPNEWDDIESIDGYPKITEFTSNYIFNLAIEFDEENHPGVMAGGLWMNKGFSSLDSPEGLKDFQVQQADFTLVAALG